MPAYPEFASFELSFDRFNKMHYLLQNDRFKTKLQHGTILFCSGTSHESGFSRGFE
jgi:hypothetical protein